MGLDDNMARANLLEDALHALNTSDNPPVSFCMQVKLQSEAYKSLDSRDSCRQQTRSNCIPPVLSYT